MKKSLILIILLALFSIAVPAQLSIWEKNKGVNIAASSKAIPQFPKSVPEYKPVTGNTDYWNNPWSAGRSLRVSEGDGWTEIPDFPHTMNHCSDGIFMVRWRVANPDIQVISTVGYNTETVNPSKTGKYGYLFASNCEEPLFKFGKALNGSEGNVVDIYYEVKLWYAAP